MTHPREEDGLCFSTDSDGSKDRGSQDSLERLKSFGINDTCLLSVLQVTVDNMRSGGGAKERGSKMQFDYIVFNDSLLM